VDIFEQMVDEDVKNGLIPFWFGFSYGTTFSAAVDVSERAFSICKKHKIWINVDAAFLGSTWISEKYRPSQEILSDIDSIDINFSKLLLNGTGGSLFYVKNKELVTEAFGASSLAFHFYKNQYSGQEDVVDYKDWIIGLFRRNSSLKLYYCLSHYGFKRLREAVEGQQAKFELLVELVKGHPDLFRLHTNQYAVTTFQCLDRDGTPSNELTQAVNARISNIK
jgi:glutamate/tyrosine decarboxylase-like PLP-dependent enzyme